MKQALVVALSLLASPVAAQANSASHDDAIRDWTYGQIIDTGSVLTTVSYYRGLADYCITETGSDPKLADDLDAASSSLDALDPETATQLHAAGAAGLVTDPTGVVPTTAISEVASIKGMDEAAFCAELSAVMRGQLHSLSNDCDVNVTRTGFDCPASRQLYVIGPDQ